MVEEKASGKGMNVRLTLNKKTQLSTSCSAEFADNITYLLVMLKQY